MDEKKVREAIEDFRLEMQTQENMISYCEQFEPKTDCRSYKEIVAMYKTAIEALEKQLPKKVEVKEWSPARCPSCGTELSEFLGDGYYRHPTFLKRCPNIDCGQLLDWSEEH